MFSPISVNKLAILCLLLLLFTAHVTAQGDNSTGCGNGAGSHNSGNNNSPVIACEGGTASSGGNLSHGDIGGIVVGVVVPVALFVLGCLKWKKIKKWYRGRREKLSNRPPILPTTQPIKCANTPVAE